MVDLEYDSAVSMLTNAVDIAETENLPDCPNIQQALINAHLQYEKFGEAFAILQRQIDFYAKNKQDHYILRAIFYGCIVLLRRDDLVRARAFVEKQSEYVFSIFQPFSSLHLDRPLSIFSADHLSFFFSFQLQIKQRL